MLIDDERFGWRRVTWPGWRQRQQRFDPLRWRMETRPLNRRRFHSISLALMEIILHPLIETGIFQKIIGFVLIKFCICFIYRKLFSGHVSVEAAQVWLSQPPPRGNLHIGYCSNFVTLSRCPGLIILKFFDSITRVECHRVGVDWILNQVELA